MDFKIILLIIFLFIINKIKIIKINNIINEITNQDDVDFSNFETKFKILAIFYPENYINKTYNRYTKQTQLLAKKEEEINNLKSLIKNQVKLAKNHGIFGFGIVYNLFAEIRFNKEIFNLFLYDKLDNFSFFIIFNNHNIYQKNSNILIENEIWNEKYFSCLIEKVWNYIFLDNYIKIEGKPILGFFNSSLSTHNFNHIRKNQDGKKNIHIIFIISIPYGNKTLEYLKKNNPFFKFQSQTIENTNNIKLKYFYNLYKDEYIKSKNIKNFFIVKGSHPEKFFILLKKYLNLTNQENDVFIINAWNDYKDNLILEPQKEFGFIYLNYLSKAIFNIKNNALHNLNSIKNKTKVAIQVHLFYLDLIKEIIKKTNNIPVKFDLYISITSSKKYDYLKNYIKNFSKANNFEILIVKNKGRDVLPFLVQVKSKYRKYKYLCHIHSKKSKHSPKIGELWRKYLYNNLLGNINIVSEILSDFEKNKKLGFIFPETYYAKIKYFYILPEKTKNLMDFLASKLFQNCKLGEFLDFPAGNMFWTKTGAIYQIFSKDLNNYFPNEHAQIRNTIMHAIERIWLYLTKYNHFNYKIIFKFF